MCRKILHKSVHRKVCVQKCARRIVHRKCAQNCAQKMCAEIVHRKCAQNLCTENVRRIFVDELRKKFFSVVREIFFTS